MERFDNENTVKLQHLAAKLDGAFGELEPARLVDVGYSRHVGRKIGKDDVGANIEGKLTEISLVDGYPGDGGNWQQINGDHLPARLHLLGRHLRPAAGRGAEVE